MRTSSVSLMVGAIAVLFTLTACGQTESAPTASPAPPPPTVAAPATPAAPQPVAPQPVAPQPATPAPAVTPSDASQPTAPGPLVGEWRLQSNSSGQSYPPAAPIEKWIFGADGQFERFTRSNARAEFRSASAGRYALDPAAGTVTFTNQDGTQIVRYYRLDTTTRNPQLRWSTTANFSRWEQFVQSAK